jgi:hypothetical protein
MRNRAFTLHFHALSQYNYRFNIDVLYISPIQEKTQEKPLIAKEKSQISKKHTTQKT